MSRVSVHRPMKRCNVCLRWVSGSLQPAAEPVLAEPCPNPDCKEGSLLPVDMVEYGKTLPVAHD